MDLRLPCFLLLILSFTAANGKYISAGMPTHEEGNAEVKDVGKTGVFFKEADKDKEDEDEPSSEITSKSIPSHAMRSSLVDVLSRHSICSELKGDYFVEGFVCDSDETERNLTIPAINYALAAEDFFALRGKRNAELKDETEDKLISEQEKEYIPTRRKRSAALNDSMRLLNIFSNLDSLPSWVFRSDKIRTKRIAGGTQAEEKEFPYQVSLRFQGLHICGGALISERHILTAAHCICGMIEEPYKELTIVTGSTTINNGGQTHLVKDVHCHHDFEYGEEHSWEDDIAVITLNQTVTFNDAQSPVKLPISDAIKSKQAVITGWGRSKPNGYLHNNLQKLSLKLLSNDECQSYYNNTVLPSQICSFNGKGSGACKGDSGSPLVLKGTIIGIFSWTKPCAIGSPEVFTRVHYFLDFIKSSMKDKVSFK